MNILTFDIEEWFHILDHKSTKTSLEWSKYESRIHNNMDKIFNLLFEKKLKATFFVVGWIAEKYPEIVKKISNNGFEVGSHTHMHQLMYEQNPKQVEEDLKKSINVIESLTGKKVKSFRAPGFSITEKNKWAFEILYENGIIYDSSIFPAGRAHGGFPAYKEDSPSIISIGGAKIKEFPINTISLYGKKLIFSGGGYFRLMPYKFIKSYTQKSKYVMTYFHPRDFDPKQPLIKDLSLIRKFKSYVGLNHAMEKLNKWTSEFDFIDISSAEKLIDWNNVPIVEI
jgi:polysaccharide deacetylase family protein (PEP-CTERM system associated)